MSARLSCLLLVLLLRGAAAPAPVPLGGAGDFVILAKTAITEVGGGIITGNIGLSPNAALAITGFALTADGSNQFATSAQVSGLVYASDYAVPTPAMLTAAVSAMEAAYTDAAGRPLSHVSNAENFDGILGGKIFTAGVYKWSTDVSFALDIILSGSVDDVFIFQIAGNLLAGSAVKVLLVADGSGHGTPWASNIIWQVAGYASLGTAAHLEGVLLVKTHCAVNAGSSINGRVLAQTAVTLETSAIITQSTSIGLHAPVLNGAAFAPTGSQLILTFDSQPTDRGGMAGVGQCALVLAAATVTTIRGGGTDEPLCYWQDDSTLVVNLDYQTLLAPGSTVSLLDGAIRPALSTSPCPSPLCAVGSVTIDINFPCGGVACTQPVAVVSGSPQISACPSEVLKLDASASNGGGIKPLAYAWRVDPTRSNFADELNARLEQLDGNDAVAIALGDLPLGGTQFVFLVNVSSSLGLASETVEFVVKRSGGAEPSFSVDGPPQRIARPALATQLLGVATLAACWQASKGVQIDFEWTLGNVTHSATGVPAPSAVRDALVLPSPLRSSLLLPPFSLLSGYTYALNLRAQMATDPSVFSDAQVALDVRAQPLQLLMSGGDRRLSAAEPFDVDASRSYDPNVRPFDAQTGELLEDAALLSAWGLRAVANGTAADALAFPAGATATGRVLQLPASSLPPGTYAITLTLSKPSTGIADATTTLLVELVAGACPFIVFEALTELKFNPTWSASTVRVALHTSLDAASLALQAAGAVSYAYEWKAYVRVAGATLPSGLDLADTGAVTTTGLSMPNLAFRSGALTAGALYRFELTVTGGPQPAFGAVDVQLNRAPWGGGLFASPTLGIALVTAFELRALGWTDDAVNLPLRYGFEFERFAGAVAITLADVQALPSLGMTLAEGASGFACVRVIDAYGAETFARTPLVVNPPPVLSCDDMVQLLEEAELAVLLGASSSAKRRLQMLADYFGRQLAACDVNGDGQVDEGLASNAPRAANASGFDSVGYSANSSLPFLNRMLVISATASATAVSTETSRRQSASTLDAILLDPYLLNGAAQVDGSAQLAAIAQGAVAGGGADQTTADALVSALGSVLVANVSRATAMQYDATNAAAIAAAGGLARAFVVGALSGEQIREALDPAISVSAARAFAASLANSTRAAPGGVGSVVLPLSIFDGQDGAAIDGGVDVLMYNFARDVHSDDQAQETLQTDLLSVTLASVSRAAALTIEGLAAPIVLAIPLAANATAEFTAVCGYWDTAAQAYLTDGLTTVAPPFGENASNASLLYCTSTHLTDFAGIILPTSKKEVIVEVLVHVNTFSITEATAALVDVNVDVLTDNAVIYGLVLGLSCACALSVALLCFLDYQGHCRRLARLAAEEEAEKATAAVLATLAVVARKQGRERFVALLASESSEAREARCAVRIQSVARGWQLRSQSTTALLGQSARKKGFSWRAVPAHLREKLLTDHSLLGIWFGDPEVQGRAELAQRFFLIIMLAVVIELLLFTPPDATVSDDSYSLASPVDVLSVVVNSVITSALVTPCLALTLMIYTWGYARSLPLAERLAGQLLGGDAARSDETLALAAKAEFRQSAWEQLRERKLEQSSARRSSLDWGAAADSHGADGGSLLLSSAGKSKRCSSVGSAPSELSSVSRVSSSFSAGARHQRVSPLLLPLPPPPLPPPPLLSPFELSDVTPTNSPPSSPHLVPFGGSPQLVSLRAPLPDRDDSVVGDDSARKRTSASVIYSEEVGKTDGWRGRVDARIYPDNAPLPPSASATFATEDERRHRRLQLSGVPHNLSKTVERKLRATFGKYDKDDSGFVNTAELGVLMHDLGFTISRRRLTALARELSGGGNEAGITLASLVLWYDGMVQKAIGREFARQSGWRKHAAALGRAITLPPRVRIVIAWLLLWAVFVALALLAVVYGRVLGPQLTRLALTSWSLAQMQTFLLQEPVLIAALALLPSLIDRLASYDVCGEQLASLVDAIVSAMLRPIKQLLFGR